MLRTTIYTIAIGTISLTSGANALSVQHQSLAQKSTSISSHKLIAQYYPVPGQYLPMPSSGQYYPQTPYNPGAYNPQGGGQYNPWGGQGQPNPSGGQYNPSGEQPNPSGGQYNTSGEQPNPPTNQPKPPTGQSNSSGGKSNSNTSAIEQSVFDQINQYRQSQNLPALTRDSRIDQQARNHSQDMASGKVPFSHQGFEQRIQATGIAGSSPSENVAYNHDKDPATAAVQGWLQSPSHLTNIRSNTNLTGIGVAVSNDGAVYLTQIFIHS